MGTVKGFKAVLQVEDPNSAGSFITVGFRRGLSMKRSNDEADITTADDLGDYSSEPTVGKTTIDWSGLLNEQNTAQAVLEEMAENKTVRNIRIVTPINLYSGLAHISDHNIDFPYDGISEVSLTFNVHGKWTKTAL